MRISFQRKIEIKCKVCKKDKIIVLNRGKYNGRPCDDCQKKIIAENEAGKRKAGKKRNNTAWYYKLPTYNEINEKFSERIYKVDQYLNNKSTEAVAREMHFNL